MIKRIVPKSGQILLKTDSEELSPLKLVEGDFILISVKKLKVAA